jgi:hypothetical protein
MLSLDPERSNPSGPNRPPDNPNDPDALAGEFRQLVAAYQSGRFREATKHRQRLLSLGWATSPTSAAVRRGVGE